MHTLNQAQQQAVAHNTGALLVLSGAGTGKTKVLTTRIARLIVERHAYPSQILAVTFTNKAAAQMRERLTDAIGEQTQELRFLGTFHAIAAKILRMHAAEIGLTSQFSIFDDTETEKILKPILSAMPHLAEDYPLPVALQAIDDCRNKGQLPNDLADTNTFKPIYSQYHAKLLALDGCDFGGLLLHNITIFKQNPAVLQKYTQRFKHVLVDEFQDINQAQHTWLQMLAQQAVSVFCVGDEDQAIYTWRGADVEFILKFEQNFAPAAIVRLEQNYRSTGHIIAAAAQLIAHNTQRLGKTLYTHSSMGNKIMVRGFVNHEDESHAILQCAQACYRMGEKNVVVLMRSAAQFRAIEEKFIHGGMAYQIIGGSKFYDRAEVRDALAYLKLLQRPHDDLAFERIINTPRRGMGAVALQKLKTLAQEQNVSLFCALPLWLAQKTRLSKTDTALQTFYNLMTNTQAQLDHVPPHMVLEQLLVQAGYSDYLRQSDEKLNEQRSDNIVELLRALSQFSDVATFLEHVSLFLEHDQNTSSADKVLLMTFHAAKGMEFDIVLLPGWEENVFPHQRALDENRLEEERRLAYVALTRAKKEVLITYSQQRRLYDTYAYNEPSRFLAELPAAHISHTPAHVPRGTFHTRPYVPRGTLKFKIEDCVEHRQYGQGVVVELDSGSANVLFNNGLQRRVLNSFLRLVEN